MSFVKTVVGWIWGLVGVCILLPLWAILPFIPGYWIADRAGWFAGIIVLVPCVLLWYKYVFLQGLEWSKTWEINDW